MVEMDTMFELVNKMLKQIIKVKKAIADTNRTEAANSMVKIIVKQKNELKQRKFETKLH